MPAPVYRPDRGSLSGWQILELFDIPFYVEPGFLLFTALIVLLIVQSSSSFVLGGLIGFVIFFSLLAHEGGHALTARLLGLNGISVSLVMFGGLTRYRETSHGRGLAIALAGPAASLALCALGWLAARTPALNMGHPAALMLSNQLFYLNGIWFLFNLLPVYPMDGGQSCFHMLALFLREPLALLIVACMSILVGGGMAALAFHFEWMMAGFFLLMFVGQNLQLARGLWGR